MTETELLPEIVPSPPEGGGGSGERETRHLERGGPGHGVETLGDVTTGPIRHAHADISDTSVSQHTGEAGSHFMWQSWVIFTNNAFFIRLPNSLLGAREIKKEKVCARQTDRDSHS